MIKIRGIGNENVDNKKDVFFEFKKMNNFHFIKCKSIKDVFTNFPDHRRVNKMAK